MQGTVLALGTAATAGAPVQPRPSLRIAVARGVLHDRYSEGTGYFQGHPDQDVTLVEEEDARAVGIEPLALRRNIVTKDVALAQLVGRTFSVGDVLLHGMRPCLPCGYLEGHLKRPGLKKDLRGGLRARVVRGGEIRVGDAVSAVPVVLDDDMRAVVESAHLAFVATVTPDGRPNLSPKGTIRVLDSVGVEGGGSPPARLFFMDLASPQTRKDIDRTPWMEVNVVDTTSRRGYRFFGRASAHVDDELHRACAARIAREEGTTYPDRGAIVLTVERALPLVSPGYGKVHDEWEMREGWKERRPALDAAFEAHVRRRGPFPGP
ncbi:MAG TPA: pyridoxamine 5'-phosphate oxidase family protein [Candidatus Thermoplasmatota archaeon]|nr:pyridoxamine 5'-phosphate oxidase family protein [Candidatus Thermoplasmatota archaeon]